MDPESWARIKEVLDEALKRPPAEREAYVRSLNLPTEICERVLEILSASVDSTNFLRSAPVLAFHHVDEVLQPASHVGPYIVIDQIGVGGMGRVYLANDPQLHRKVALKCLIGVPDARIINEAIAAAQLNHPNVAAVYHVIEDAHRVFIVMEYVDGENLAAKLRRERLSVLQAVTIGERLSSALAAAHAKGIIHRDLKPGNVQFTYDGTPKVLDFGIANLAMTMTVTSHATTTNLPKPARGPHPGTPPYMSPEQLRGQDLDERSDIFSLGVLLFEMTTGQRPFPSTDHNEILALQAKGAPRADSVNPKIPRGLADVIARTLEVDRLRRPPAAREVEAALEDVAIRLRPKVVRELILRWLTRVAIGVPVLVVAMGLIGFLTTLFFNVVFGRDGEFGRFAVEPFLDNFRWGLLVVFPSIVLMIVTMAVFLAARSGLRVLEAAGPIGRRIRSVSATIAANIHDANLDTSPVLAQFLAGFGIISIAVLFWFYSDLVNAWSSFINSAPLERLVPVGPHLEARNHYHAFNRWLHALLLVMVFGLIKVLRFRQAERTNQGTPSLIALNVVLAVMVIALCFPYRMMNHRDMERVELSGVGRCYINGQTDVEFLVLCPQSSPPRNRAVRRDSPGLMRTGVVENVFESLRPKRSGPGS